MRVVILDRAFIRAYYLNLNFKLEFIFKLDILSIYASTIIMRHQNLERVGLHKVALVVEEEFEWIFREQPIVDVGIDALIEKSVQGEPVGKFLALQIKSGEGNVYESKTKAEFTYYMTDVHYYYWTNLDFPLLLLCYITLTKNIYWAEVNKGNCSRTEKGWKISLPKANVFDKRAYSKINKILITSNRNILNITDEKNEAIYNLEHLDLVTDSLFLLTTITNKHTERLLDTKNKLLKLDIEGESAVKYSMVEIQKYKLVTAFETVAARLYNEINIFSRTYIKAISAIKINCLRLLQQGNKDFIEIELASITSMVEAFTGAINGMESMKSSVSALIGEKILYDDSSLEKAESAISTVVLNLTQSQNLGRRLIEDIHAEMSR